LKDAIPKLKIENKALVSDIAIMKSAITAPDNSAENDARIQAAKQALKKSQRDLGKLEKEYNDEKASFEQKKLMQDKIFKRITAEIVKSNTPESRKIQELVKKFEATAVTQVNSNYLADLQKEQQIAEIHRAREHLIYADHQLKLTRKRLSEIMSWKDRVAFHDELKFANPQAATAFFEQVIRKKESDTLPKMKKSSAKKLSRIASAKSMSRSIRSSTFKRTIGSKSRK
jgi:hypothetical protein